MTGETDFDREIAEWEAWKQSPPASLAWQYAKGGLEFDAVGLEAFYAAAYAAGEAAERDRISAELGRLRQEREEDQSVIAVWRGRTQQAEAQRDALLEALRLMMDCAGDIATAPDSTLEMALDDDEEETRRQANAFLVARAAIAKAEGDPCA